ncbi:hypothetical protein KY336_02835 [Candidatus Woesearchaeota archaeon]|nr:hypothetical protein [Candidatus Woesearchaeota archaeon]
MAENNSIYLIGSYTGHRDKIIEALPERSFADPRDQRQSSVAKLVCDNLQMAEECPIALAFHPGVMSFVEMGAAVTHGNHLIVVDDSDKHPFLELFAGSYFTKMYEAIDFLKGKPDLPKNDKKIRGKYPAGSREYLPLNKVLISGAVTPELTSVIKRAEKARPDRKFYFCTDIYREFTNIFNYDLLVVNFPGDEDWNKQACLLMGAASAHDISILLMDEHDWKYPPLQAVARRHCTINVLFEYLTEVDDLNISSEARDMYKFFQREQERRRS